MDIGDIVSIPRGAVMLTLDEKLANDGIPEIDLSVVGMVLDDVTQGLFLGSHLGYDEFLVKGQKICLRTFGRGNKLIGQGPDDLGQGLIVVSSIVDCDD